MNPAELAAVMDNFQAKTPNARFIIAPSSLSTTARWRALDGDGAVRFPGVDAVIFDPDRKLVQVSGFFDTLPIHG